MEGGRLCPSGNLKAKDKNRPLQHTVAGGACLLAPRPGFLEGRDPLPRPPRALLPPRLTTTLWT